MAMYTIIDSPQTENHAIKPQEPIYHEIDIKEHKEDYSNSNRHLNDLGSENVYHKIQYITPKVTATDSNNLEEKSSDSNYFLHRTKEFQVCL